ncbi:response regulator [Paenibacillus frigoriresistens]|uniref:response regulator transcription factor n=1 Tax=Paenibacillus alginolyticus TaxID=59839 RepID=UPI001563E389|nr:response regulator [Paenibacillus frigoriresistens]NRF96160.1 response regulator [Paenibacillus frigoriresistens]
MDNKEIQVMVVDDEAGVRRSLIEKLRKIDIQVTVTAEAESAEDAYNCLQTKKFDIIFLDMRMPGMGGKRFLSLLQEEYPSTKVIVLSGYSDYEYLQQSLRTGVVDYLLKPVIKEELERALTKAIKLTMTEREKKEKEYITNSLLNQSLPLLKYQLLNRILRPSINASVLQKLKLLQVHFDDSIYVMAVASIRKDDRDEEDILTNGPHEHALRFFTFENIVQDTLIQGIAPICFPHSQHDWEFIMIFNLPKDEEKKGFEKMEEQIRLLVNNLERYGKMQTDIILSKPFKFLEQAWVTYEEISGQYKHNSSEHSGFQVAEQVDSSFETNLAISQKYVASFITALEEGDFHSITAWMTNIWQIPSEVFESNGYIDEKQIAVSLYILIKDVIERSFVDEHLIHGSMQKLFELLKLENETEKWHNEFLKIAVEISGLAYNRSRMDAHQMMVQAKQFIERHYFENLSLEAISNKFYLNRTYFSELFKKELGWTFKKYLNHVRIEKAKQFLSEQDLRPSLVAELVGIQDPVYFSVLFKKMTGITPGVYRNKYRQGQDEAP